MNEFEFNPKEKLWKEELAVSGIHNNILGAIGAAVGLVGSIAGASQAKSNERSAKKAEKERVEALNEYNKEKFENDEENFFQTRDFNWQQALKKYEYDTEILVRNYQNQAEVYGVDQQNLKEQLQNNKEGERLAYLREQTVMQEIRNEQAFGRLDLYVDSLKKKATTVGSNPGASSGRAAMMHLMDQGRKLAIMDASYSGAINSSAMNMFDIAMRKEQADDTARSQTMLRPKMPIPLIRPENTPIPIFTEPGEAQPGFVPSSSGLASIAGSVGGAISTIGTSIGNRNLNNPVAPSPVGGGTFDLNSNYGGF
tara:strand:- start:2213 stop:3145 length:933 start_codon:yes stop_codon:yes gene_type:complete